MLVPLGNHITNEELKSFEIFKSYCVESFDTIESKKMATLPLAKSSHDDGPKLVKKLNSNKPQK